MGTAVARCATAISLIATGCGRFGFGDAASDARGGDASGDTSGDGSTPDPALIAYFPFDGTLVDASGHGHDATAQGTTFDTGRRGQGLALTATTFAIVSSLTPLALGAGDFTVSLCVNALANLGIYDMPFFMGGGSAFVSGIDFEFGTSGWASSIKDGGGDADQFLMIGDQSLTGTGFHCFAARVTRATATASGFRDGVRVQDQDASTLMAFAPGDMLRFGGDNANMYPFSGVVDEVRIYTRALTDAEIATLHAP